MLDWGRCKRTVVYCMVDSLVYGAFSSIGITPPYIFGNLFKGYTYSDDYVGLADIVLSTLCVMHIAMRQSLYSSSYSIIKDESVPHLMPSLTELQTIFANTTLQTLFRQCLGIAIEHHYKPSIMELVAYVCYSSLLEYAEVCLINVIFSYGLGYPKTPRGLGVAAKADMQLDNEIDKLGDNCSEPGHFFRFFSFLLNLIGFGDNKSEVNLEIEKPEVNSETNQLTEVEHSI